MYEWRPDRRSACSFFYVKLKKNNPPNPKNLEKIKRRGFVRFHNLNQSFEGGGDSKNIVCYPVQYWYAEKVAKTRRRLVFHGFVSGGDGFKSSSRLDDNDSEDAFGGDIHDGVQASFH